MGLSMLPQSVPLLDSTGKLARDWYSFIRQIWQHTGAGGAAHPRYTITNLIAGQVLDRTASSVNDLYLYFFSPHFHRSVALFGYLPLSYTPNTDIIPVFNWFCLDTDSGLSIWELEYAWVNTDGDALTDTTIERVTSQAPGEAFKPTRVVFPDIAGLGMRPGSIFMGTLSHRGDDDYPGISHDTYMLSFGLIHQVSGVGHIDKNP